MTDSLPRGFSSTNCVSWAAGGLPHLIIINRATHWPHHHKKLEWRYFIEDTLMCWIASHLAPTTWVGILGSGLFVVYFTLQLVTFISYDFRLGDSIGLSQYSVSMKIKTNCVRRGVALAVARLIIRLQQQQQATHTQLWPELKSHVCHQKLIKLENFTKLAIR